MKITTTDLQQQKAVIHIADTYRHYKELLEPYYDRLLDVYKELNTFSQPKKTDWGTSFKVNKMHEVSNKILPRIISRNPKWIVSTKPDIITKAMGEWKDIWELELQAHAIQDLLTTTFDKYNLQEPVRLRAKGMVNYGMWFAKIVTKYDITRYEEQLETPEIETYMDENWEEQTKEIKKKIKEKVANEYVTVEPVSWTDLYFDPRYVMFRDMPWVIHLTNWVRLADLKRNKEDYINIDKLEDLCNLNKSDQNYKEQVQAVTGIQITTAPDIEKNNLNLREYYGCYDPKETGDEKLYKICVVNDLICIKIEEITSIPFEQIRCFEDTETNLATGFLEPIIWLQKELNYKKNSASEYINHALNRSWIWSPNSWINPKKLISRPNNIIPTTKTVADAMNNLQEIPHRTLDASYFQEQNDFERQIQGLTFTIDTNNSQNTQWLTNTATWIRIKFFESNVVIDEIRKHFEQWLERLAYKLLDQIANNLDSNLTIKQMEDDGFREINKEAIKNSLGKYEIKIETGTSSYDTLESRREDAIAKFNILMQAMWAWMPVNMDEWLKDVLGTFEWTIPDKYIQKQQIMPQLPWNMQPLQQPEQTPSWASEITEQIAQGGLTAGL